MARRCSDLGIAAVILVFQCGGKGHGAGHIDCSGAGALLLPTVVQGLDIRRAPGEHQCPCPHRTSHLVSGNAHGGCSQSMEIQRNITTRRHRIQVEEGVMFAREASHFLHGLNRPHFIVGDQRRAAWWWARGREALRGSPDP